MFYLKTLGELTLYRSNQRGEPVLGSSKPLVLLALLAVMPEGQRREHVAELLWPDSDRVRSRRSLRQALFQVSKDADGQLILSDDSSASLRVNRRLLSVDVWDFDRAMESEDYAAAVELYDGPFLAGADRGLGSEAEHAIEAENARLKVALEVAYTRLVSICLEAGDREAALKHARAFAERNPLDEQAQAVLVRTLKEAGSEVEALSVYQSYRTLLNESIGEEPSEELRRLADELRADVLRPNVSSVRPPETEADREWSLALPSDRPGRMLEPQPPGAPAAGRIAPSPMARRALATLGIGIGVPALVLAVALGVWGMLVLRRTVGIDGDLNASVVAMVGEGAAGELVRVDFRGGTAAVRPLNRPASERPSPNGRYVALSLRAPDGWNVALRDEIREDTVVITERPGDERAVGWSPDSRFLLYWESSIVAAGRERSYRVLVYDTETRARRPLMDRTSQAEIAAAWSPDGSRIAVVVESSGQSDVFISDFDGRVVRNVSAHPRWDGEPDWSADGEHLAFVSRRSGSADIYMVRSGGDTALRLTDVEGDVRTPVWLSASALVFVRTLAGASDIWALDVVTQEVRRLTGRGDISRLVRHVPDGTPGGWIDRVRVTPRHDDVSPGQYLRFRVLLQNAAGETVQRHARIRWHSDAPAVLRPVEPGEFQVVDVGNAQVSASLGGWRADTLELNSLPLRGRELTAEFAEDWAAGLRPERWIPYGEPHPYARGAGGPGGGVLVNNGDAYFRSGVVSNRSFSWESGLTLEVYGRPNFTGRLHQVFGIALFPETPPTGDWSRTRATVQLLLRGAAAGDPAEAVLQVLGEREVIPFPTGMDRWRHYAIQLNSDGQVDLIIDGQLYYRSARRLSPDRHGPFRVALGHQSFGTEVMHGPLQLYSSPKYVLSKPSGQATGRAGHAEPGRFPRPERRASGLP